jgi:ribosomal protein L11 methyltransferase
VSAHIQVVVLTVPINDVELAADALWQGGTSAVEERPGEVSGTVTLVADALPSSVQPGWTLDSAEVDDGLDAWRDHARAWQAGPFTVRPPWVPRDAAGGIDLVIDPGRAFGSGSHPTTRLTLAALPGVVEPRSSVLDVGCGSGVLAVAAALLGAATVDATDIDPAALTATAANAAANGVSVRVGEPSGPYDVVVANILAVTLIELASLLSSSGDVIVLSGMLAAQADAVAAAFADHAEISRTDEDGWVALVLHRRVTEHCSTVS